MKFSDLELGVEYGYRIKGLEGWNEPEKITLYSLDRFKMVSSGRGFQQPSMSERGGYIQTTTKVRGERRQIVKIADIIAPWEDTPALIEAHEAGQRFLAAERREREQARLATAADYKAEARQVLDDLGIPSGNEVTIDPGGQFVSISVTELRKLLDRQEFKP